MAYCGYYSCALSFANIVFNIIIITYAKQVVVVLSLIK